MDKDVSLVNEKNVLSETIIAIGYDSERNETFLLINPTQWLYNTQIRKLSLEKQAELISKLSNVAALFLEDR